MKKLLRYSLIVVVVAFVGRSLYLRGMQPESLSLAEERNIVQQLLQELQQELNANKPSKAKKTYQNIQNSIQLFKQMPQEEKDLAFAQANEVYAKKVREGLQDWIANITQFMNNGEIEEALAVFQAGQGNSMEDNFRTSPFLTQEEKNNAFAKVEAILDGAFEMQGKTQKSLTPEQEEVININTPEGAQAYFRLWVKDMQQALAEKNKMMIRNLLGEANFIQSMKFLSPDDKAKVHNLAEIAKKELNLAPSQPEKKKEYAVQETKKEHEAQTIATDINSISDAKNMLQEWTRSMQDVLKGFSADKDFYKNKALKLLEQLQIIKDSPYLTSPAKHNAINLAMDVQKKYNLPQLAKKIYTQEMLEEWLQSMNFVLAVTSPKDARNLLEDVKAIEGSPQLTSQDKQKAMHKADEVRKKYKL